MDSNHIKILITEDESIIALDIKRILEKMGYEITAIATRFEDAIKQIELKKPDLILMDIHLVGEKNGIESAEYIFKKYFIPFVYLTAMTDEETVQKAKKTEPFGYIIKPFDEISLRSTIEMAVYKFSIESELKKKTLELENEKQLNDQLSDQILPGEIIQEFKNRGVMSPRLYKNAAILIAHFEFPVNLTQNVPGDIIRNELTEIFLYADEITKKYDLQKLKSSANIYMISAGIPVESDDDARRIVLAAMDIQSYLLDRNLRLHYKCLMKTGINSGQVVAGTVENKECIYDVWGKAVNIARNLESLSEWGKINISKSTYEQVKDSFECEYRGNHPAKGNGDLDMYFVNNLKSVISV